jgi:hypothetical protein
MFTILKKKYSIPSNIRYHSNYTYSNPKNNNNNEDKKLLILLSIIFYWTHVRNH